MYEMTTAISAERSLRPVRERALPSMQRERVQRRDLRLQAIATASAPASRGRGLFAQLGALLAHRPGQTAAAA